MELDWEGAFCRKYVELWFSLQNKHLRDKGRITIIVGIGALTSGVETLLGRKIEKFNFPDYTPFVGNKLQSDTIEYVYYKYTKRLLKIEEIDGIYSAWLVDKQEVNKRISWILEYNDPKRYLDGLIRNAGQFPTEAYPEFNYENYKG